MVGPLDENRAQNRAAPGEAPRTPGSALGEQQQLAQLALAKRQQQKKQKLLRTARTPNSAPQERGRSRGKARSSSAAAVADASPPRSARRRQRSKSRTPRTPAIGGKAAAAAATATAAAAASAATARTKSKVSAKRLDFVTALETGLPLAPSIATEEGAVSATRTPQPRAKAPGSGLARRARSKSPAPAGVRRRRMQLSAKATETAPAEEAVHSGHLRHGQAVRLLAVLALFLIFTALAFLGESVDDKSPVAKTPIEVDTENVAGEMAEEVAVEVMTTGMTEARMDHVVEQNADVETEEEAADVAEEAAVAEMAAVAEEAVDDVAPEMADETMDVHVDYSSSSSSSDLNVDSQVPGQSLALVGVTVQRTPSSLLGRLTHWAGLSYSDTVAVDTAAFALESAPTTCWLVPCDVHATATYSLSAAAGRDSRTVRVVRDDGGQDAGGVRLRAVPGGELLGEAASDALVVLAKPAGVAGFSLVVSGPPCSACPDASACASCVRSVALDATT